MPNKFNDEILRELDKTEVGKWSSPFAIEAFKSFLLTALTKAREDERKQPHNTEHGWCCACEYDVIELNRRVEQAVDDYQTNYEQQHIASAVELTRVELLSKIKGLGATSDDVCIKCVAKILNKLNGYEK